MADRDTNPNVSALRKLEASVHQDLLERAAFSRLAAATAEPMEPASSVAHLLGADYRRLRLIYWWMRLRTLTYVAAALAAVVLMGLSTLWWRLGSGPIEFDVATPWLAAAIEENFGSQHQVEVGGTQIERDANGRTALRIRDIVVRDPEGAIVASAPKAEVGVSSSGLFTGRFRAERLSLVGAEMHVRIEPDSKLTVFAGANKRPFVTAEAANVPLTARMAYSQVSDRGIVPAGPPTPLPRATLPDFSALLAWIDSLSATGLDGRDLTELGLKSGNLTVDDQRNGKKWTFQDINLSITRPSAGGVALTLSSEAIALPWLVRAAMTPAANGHRIVDIETQKLPARDLMLAMRLGDGQYEPDIPVSARIHADFGPDGVPQTIAGRVVMEKGFIIDNDEPDSRIAIDRAEFSLDWDAARQALAVPLQLISGANRFTLLAQLDAPRESGGAWGLNVTGGTIALSINAADTRPLVLNRVQLKLRVDPDKQRIDVEQGDLGNADIGLAISGGLDYASGEPRLALGIAGNSMSAAAMKRLWPAVLSPKVRDWFVEHVISGTVERMVIATNAPLQTLKPGGPPVPDDGLAIEIVGHGAEIHPIAGLPSIRDADINLRISGRTAVIGLGRGNVELSPGRKLAITNGSFEVADTHPNSPAAKVRFRLDGPVAVAAEVLALERLRDYAGSPLDPATSRGTLSAQIQLGMQLRPDMPPGSTQYSINMDLSNFAADKLIMNQKVEANTLRVNANNQGYYIRGDVKLNGVAAALDYRKPRGDGDAEVRLQSTLDDAARQKFGFDLGAYMSGPIAVKLNGRIPVNEGDGSRFAIEADLSQARIDRLLPGWTKPAGRTARSSFTLISRHQSSRLEDFVIEATGTSVKGTIELDGNGEVLTANLPVFNLADGDKATLRAERGPDGALRVMMRGDVYDGRGFIKAAMAGPSAEQAKTPARDVDIDVRLGTVAGFHGETLRGLDLRMSRRGGAIISFGVNAKLGRDATVVGDLRGRGGNGNANRNVLFVESTDAGAFFRFSDSYPKIFGGQMWLAMDPPGADPRAPVDGTLNIRDFAVRGESALDRVAAGGPQPGGAGNAQRPGVEFARMQVEFTRALGRFAIREGIVKGPMIGATTEGYIDSTKDEVRMRGTFVPFYGINNMFGQIPLFGLFLGGGNNEGLVGLTFEVVGQPSAPTLRVNPISAVAPGLLRKFFEFPTTTSAPTQSISDQNR